MDRGRPSRWVLVLLGLGCTPDPVEVEPPSSGGDAATSPTASGAEDAATDDATAGTGADAGSTDPPGAACDERYGMAPGYLLCMETADECHFNASTSGNCNEMCAALGGTCLAAFDNPNDEGMECDIIRPNEDDCDTDRGTEICVCDR